MKLKITFFLLAVTLASQVKCQEVTVEKTLWGIQTGLLGLWVNNEAKLSGQSVIKTEFGLDAGFFGGTYYEKTGFLLTPVITAEPRWYYNLRKRDDKEKDVAKNSANFLSIRFSYYPDWFSVSNYENMHIVEQIAIIPKWGIKRTLGNHFTYELGIGIGYRNYLWKTYGFARNEGEVAADLHMRLGYSF